MSTDAFKEIIRAEPADRADLFLTTAQRLGAPLINIEKDFWVCWTLNTLYHRLPSHGPRLLFKGGTSLSKAYSLISRFSEDIDVTVFRDELGQPATTAEITALSNKKRKAALDAIAADCSNYITTDLRASVAEILDGDTEGLGLVEVDKSDTSNQTLLVWYPRVETSETTYVQAAVKIESGAKSALAKTFFSRPDFDLASAAPGTFSLRPVGDMIERLARDYDNTRAMIFGDAPAFEDIMSSVGEIEDSLNAPAKGANGSDGQEHG